MFFIIFIAGPALALWPTSSSQCFQVVDGKLLAVPLNKLLGELKSSKYTSMLWNDKKFIFLHNAVTDVFYAGIGSLIMRNKAKTQRGNYILRMTGVKPWLRL